MHTQKTILAMALLVLSGTAHAVAPGDLRDQFDGLVTEHMPLASGSFQVPTDFERREIIGLLERDPRVAAAPRLTAGLVSRVVYDNIVKYRVTVDEARSLVTHYVGQMAAGPNPRTLSQLAQLVLPYAVDAGMCSGDPLDDQGATCAFAFGPDGKLTGNVAGDANPIGNPDPDSVLFQVLSGCDEDDEECRALAAPLLGDEPASDGTWSGLDLDAVYESLASFDYSRLLSLVGIGSAHAAWYDYEETWKKQGGGERGLTYQGIPMRLAYQYGYYIRLRCGPSAGFGCDLWGEIAAVGNLKYLVSGSDMMMAVLPFALRCPASCFFSGLAGYAWSWANDRWLGGKPTFDAQAFVLSTRDNVKLRNAGSYSRLLGRGLCGVVPIPYQTRPTHAAYKAWSEDIPYGEAFDLSPHTSFQVPTTDPLTPLLSHNMDPMPTKATGEISTSLCNPLPIKVDFSWRYDFLLVSAWNFNVMFAGLDNVNPTNYCGPDQVWVWYGAPGGGSKGLPALTWTFAFAGGHPAYVGNQLN